MSDTVDGRGGLYGLAGGRAAIAPQALADYREALLEQCAAVAGLSTLQNALLQPTTADAALAALVVSAAYLRNGLGVVVQCAAGNLPAGPVQLTVRGGRWEWPATVVTAAQLPGFAGAPASHLGAPVLHLVALGGLDTPGPVAMGGEPPGLSPAQRAGTAVIAIESVITCPWTGQLLHQRTLFPGPLGDTPLPAGFSLSAESYPLPEWGSAAPLPLQFACMLPHYPGAARGPVVVAQRASAHGSVQVAVNVLPNDDIALQLCIAGVTQWQRVLPRGGLSASVAHTFELTLDASGALATLLLDGWPVEVTPG